MAKHSYERARWNRREALRRMRLGKWPYFRWDVTTKFRQRPQDFFDDGAEIDFSQTVWKLFRLLPIEQQDKISLEAYQRRMSMSAHGGLSHYTRRYRRLWRRQAHQQERLHRLGQHDEADDLHPQPRKLGVMWDIW